MNSIGRKFRVSIIGESHGSYVGVVIDGCPAGISICEADFFSDISRRKSGAVGTTPRQEEDVPILSTGVYNGYTTGAPLTILFENKNTKSADYDALKAVPRPGHADYVLMKKYNEYNDPRGGGHSSGRLTLGMVAAGVVAKKVLGDVAIKATLTEAGGNTNIEEAIAKAIEEQDSIGGIIICRTNNIPVGWGEPFFDSVESVLSHAIFAIPAIKGIEFGSGFAAAKMKGSNHNDAILDMQGTTATNNAGGINGGITNGNELVFKVAVKPTSSTPKEQNTLNIKSGKVEPFIVKGRHDLCIALRVPVVVEAVTAIVLADFKLLA